MKTVAFLFFSVCGVACAAEPPVPAPAGSTARALVESSGVPGGVCVQVGIKDSRLLTAVAREGRFIVQGLSSDDEVITACRRQILSEGMHGRVTVDSDSERNFPYADSMVNILIAATFAEPAKQSTGMAEIWRVLCPGGSAFLGPDDLPPKTVEEALTQAGIRGAEVTRNDKWVRVRKPRPQDMDVWTHYRHDADRNIVSSDMVAGNLSRLQWVARPVIARMVNNVVTADGRIYYWVLKGAPHAEKPSEFSLIARDAFNGVLLWERNVRGELPQVAPMVAVGGNLYTVLELASKRAGPIYGANMFVSGGPLGPLHCLDGATGEVHRTYQGIAAADVAYSDGTLVVADGRGAKAAFDAKTGRMRWNTSGKGPLIVADGVLFLGTITHLAALDLKTGREVWRNKTGIATRRSWGELLCHYRGILVALDDNKVRAFSAKDGRPLWAYECNLKHRDVFGVHGLIWAYVREESPANSERWAVVGLDPPTGREVRRVNLPDGYPEEHKQHPNCYPMRATDRFLVLNEQTLRERRNDLLDWQGKAVTTLMPFKRGGCSYGLLPANGMFYLPPFQCRCTEAKRYMTGFAAIAPGPTVQQPAAQEILEKGPAFDSKLTDAPEQKTDWPSMLHDNSRSNATPSALSKKLQLLWDAGTGGRPVGLTAAEGVVTTAVQEQHTIRAFDSDTGRPLWSFTAGAQVDTPPTLARGRCLFGSNDGWVYCLRLADGKLAWRFRASADRRIVAYDRIESTAPVPGSVVAEGDTVYYSSGRAATLDDSLHVHALDILTGRQLWRSAAHAARGPNDILVIDGDTIRLQAQVFDIKTGQASNRTRGDRYLVDYNDYTWWGRPKFYSPIPAERLASDENRYYGVRWDVSPQTKLKYNPVERAVLVGKSRGKNQPSWEVPLPFMGNALCAARGTVLVAGPNRAPATKDADQEGQVAGVLWLVDGESGRKLKEIRLPGVPIDDGLIVASGKLFVATVDGRILCFDQR